MADNSSKLDQIRNLREARALAAERVSIETEADLSGDKIPAASEKAFQTEAS
ncbi:MAG TPA: hypothetical protein VFA65_23050 [Bryobacteraceae bacterium]|nr:hypothetical protein [Bryobacteraceae bacterium]